MSILDLILPLQVGGGIPSPGPSSPSRQQIFCVPEEDETDWEQAFRDFAQDRCSISQEQYRTIRAEEVTSARGIFIGSREEGGSPRFYRINRWERIADFFDDFAGGVLSLLGRLIRWGRGDSYCGGADILYVNQAEICDTLRRGLVVEAQAAVTPECPPLPVCPTPTPIIVPIPISIPEPTPTPTPLVTAPPVITPPPTPIVTPTPLPTTPPPTEDQLRVQRAARLITLCHQDPTQANYDDANDAVSAIQNERERSRLSDRFSAECPRPAPPPPSPEEQAQQAVRRCLAAPSISLFDAAEHAIAGVSDEGRRSVLRGTLRPCDPCHSVAREMHDTCCAANPGTPSCP